MTSCSSFSRNMTIYSYRVPVLPRPDTFTTCSGAQFVAASGAKSTVAKASDVSLTAANALTLPWNKDSWCIGVNVPAGSNQANTTLCATSNGAGAVCGPVTNTTFNFTYPPGAAQDCVTVAIAQGSSSLSWQFCAQRFLPPPSPPSPPVRRLPATTHPCPPALCCSRGFLLFLGFLLTTFA